MRYDDEPAQRAALPKEEDWDTGAYLRHLPLVFEAVRAEFGPRRSPLVSSSTPSGTTRR